MEEEQADAVPSVPDAQSSLPTDEGEVAAQLEEERLEVLDEGGFEVGLRVLVPRAEKLEDERILQFLFGEERIGRLALSALASIEALFFERAVRS